MAGIVHTIAVDDGKDEYGDYLAGRDCRNIVARCSCGWTYGAQFLAIEEASKSHVEDNCPFPWADQRREKVKERTRKF